MELYIFEPGGSRIEKSPRLTIDEDARGLGRSTRLASVGRPPYQSHIWALRRVQSVAPELRQCCQEIYVGAWIGPPRCDPYWESPA